VGSAFQPPGTASWLPPTKPQQFELLGDLQPRGARIPAGLPFGEQHRAVKKVAGDRRVPLVLKSETAGGGERVRLFRGTRILSWMLSENPPGPYALLQHALSGPEWSVQGQTRDGDAQIRAVTEKIVALGDRFRPSAYIGHWPREDDADFVAIARAAATRTGCPCDPWHVEIMRDHDGSSRILEIDFRHSGVGVTEMVSRISGVSWIAEDFAAQLGEPAPRLAPSSDYFGAVELNDQDEVARAQFLGGVLGAVYTPARAEYPGPDGIATISSSDPAVVKHAVLYMLGDRARSRRPISLASNGTDRERLAELRRLRVPLSEPLAALTDRATPRLEVGGRPV
jgi:hypothetical protein